MVFFQRIWTVSLVCNYRDEVFQGILNEGAKRRAAENSFQMTR